MDHYTDPSVVWAPHTFALEESEAVVVVGTVRKVVVDIVPKGATGTDPAAVVDTGLEAAGTDPKVVDIKAQSEVDHKDFCLADRPSQKSP